MSRLKIAVTGGFGSGKSTVCRIFRESGYTALNADEIAKNIVAGDPEVRSKITGAFGSAAYIDGKPNSKFLAGIVFDDPEKLALLNSIVHPPTIAFIRKSMDNELRAKKMVFAEAALIYEAEMEEMFDYVILVTCKLEDKIRRTKSKLGLSEEEILKRIKNQIPDEEKANLADFVINNDSSPEELEARALFVLRLLEGLIT